MPPFRTAPFHPHPASRIGALLVALAALSGCAASPRTAAPPPAVSTAEEAAVAGRFAEVEARWRGTPYRFGGTDRGGIDCSAFVQAAFAEAFGLGLTRTTRTQSREGKPVARKDLRVGDLVFFLTGRNRRHVGIWLGGERFLHASSRRGVTTDRLAGFYARTYWMARRVLPERAAPPALAERAVVTPLPPKPAATPPPLPPAPARRSGW